MEPNAFSGFDDPESSETTDTYDRLDPSFPKGENPELDSAADALLVGRVLAGSELRGQCDFPLCKSVGEKRFDIKDAYSPGVYYRVCLAHSVKSETTNSPTLTKHEARAEEARLAHEADLESLMAQTGYVVRHRGIVAHNDVGGAPHRGRRSPASVDVTWELSLMGAQDYRRKADNSAVARKRAKDTRDIKHAQREEREADFARRLLAHRAAVLGREIEDLLKSRKVPRSIIDLSLLQFVELYGFETSSLVRATGYAPHQIRDALGRARREVIKSIALDRAHREGLWRAAA